MKPSWDEVTKKTRTPIDPKHGQGLRHAVEERRAELEAALAELQNTAQQNGTIPNAIEDALAMLDAMLPEDLEHITPVIAAQLANWLEVHKHLGIIEGHPAQLGFERHTH